MKRQIIDEALDELREWRGRIDLAIKALEELFYAKIEESSATEKTPPKKRCGPHKEKPERTKYQLTHSDLALVMSSTEPMTVFKITQALRAVNISVTEKKIGDKLLSRPDLYTEGPEGVWKLI